MTVYAGMQMRRRGGTGRHAILRGKWRKPYEFESHRRYHGYFANRIRSLSLKAYSEQASLTIRRNTRAARPSPESQLWFGFRGWCVCVWLVVWARCGVFALYFLCLEGDVCEVVPIELIRYCV